MDTIGIIGGGWLAKKWINQFSETKFIITNRQTISMENNPNVIRQIAFEIGKNQLNELDWKGCDLIVIAIPFSSKNSTENNLLMAKSLIRSLSKIELPIILLSSTSIYPNTPTLINESNLDTLLNLSCVENEFKSIKNCTILRLGGLMGNERKLSKYIKEGDLTVVNYVHYSDVFNAITHIFSNKLWNNTYNLVAPYHPTKKELTHFEMKGELISVLPNTKQRIIDSSKILKTGFLFKHENPLFFP